MNSSDPPPIITRRQRFWVGMLAIGAFFTLLGATIAVPRYEIGIVEVLGTLGLAGAMLSIDVVGRTGL